MGEADTSGLWTVVSLANRLFAISAADVETMVLLPTVSAVPELPSHVRGVFVLRGSAVPVIDLRKRLGMLSLSEETDELIAMLSQREADHRHWLDELERSVKERREFTLTTDAHECAFGKWYDTYQTDSLMLQGLLKRFDAPHKRIHAIADDVLRLEHEGDAAGAQALLDATRDGDLAEMIRLFEALALQIRESQREIAVVVNCGDRSFAVAVDSVETVSELISDVGEDVDDIGVRPTETGVLRAVGKLDKGGRLVIVLDTAGVVKGHDIPDAALA